LITKDYLGSWYAVTDDTGRIATFHDEEQRYSFDPWGRRRNALSWEYEDTPNSFLIDRGYTGHEHLDAFELINMNGRVYDPVIARFLSVDPIMQNAGNAQNFNSYSYCLNNPLKYIDPSGYKVHLYDEEGNPFCVTYGPSLGGYSSQNPGSGLHWFDRDRSMFGNFMLMNSGTFMACYSISQSVFDNYIIPYHQQLPKTSNISVSKNGQAGFWIDWSTVKKNAKWDGCQSKNNYLEEYEFGSKFIAIKTEGSGLGEIFEGFEAGIVGIGTAEHGSELFIREVAGARTYYTTFSGGTKYIGKARLLGYTEIIGKCTFGVGLIVNVGGAALGEQSWGKAALNIGVEALPFIIGAGPGMAIGVFYFAVDKTIGWDKVMTPTPNHPGTFIDENGNMELR
jgi:RHS repeat-associated protein